MRLINKMFSIVSEGETVRIQLHPEHVIYQAHFPGSPITPGVCIIQYKVRGTVFYDETVFTKFSIIYR